MAEPRPQWRGVLAGLVWIDFPGVQIENGRRVMDPARLLQQPPAQPIRQQPKITATRGRQIRSQKSEGTYVFDNAAGHILRSSLKESIEVAASVKVGLGALAKDMEIIQSNETTTSRKLVK